MWELGKPDDDGEMLASNDGPIFFATEADQNPKRYRDLMDEAAWKTLHIGFFEGPQRP
jgi:hypothetical protein